MSPGAPVTGPGLRTGARRDLPTPGAPAPGTARGASLPVW